MKVVPEGKQGGRGRGGRQVVVGGCFFLFSVLLWVFLHLYSAVVLALLVSMFVSALVHRVSATTW